MVRCRTWTSPVEPIKCLEAIKEHAFATSPYPVILTLEDHLTPDLQAKVAKVPVHRSPSHAWLLRASDLDLMARTDRQP